MTSRFYIETFGLGVLGKAHKKSYQAVEVSPMHKEMEFMVLLAKSKGAGDPLPGENAPFTVYPALKELKHVQDN